MEEEKEEEEKGKWSPGPCRRYSHLLPISLDDRPRENPQRKDILRRIHDEEKEKKEKKQEKEKENEEGREVEA